MSMIVMEPVGVCASGPLCVSSKVKSERTKVLQKPDKYENHLPSQGWKKVICTAKMVRRVLISEHARVCKGEGMVER